MKPPKLYRKSLIFISIISFLALIGLNTSNVQAAIDPQRTPGVFDRHSRDYQGIYQVPTTTTVRGNTVIQDYYYPPQSRLEYSPQIAPHPYKSSATPEHPYKSSATPAHPYKSTTTDHPYK